MMRTISDVAMIILLVAGIILTVITVRLMIKGQIVLPLWAKILLSAAMILGQLITFLSLLPPLEVAVKNPLITTQQHIVTPADPSEGTTPTTD